MLKTDRNKQPLAEASYNEQGKQQAASHYPPATKAP